MNPRPITACRANANPNLTIVIDEHARTLIVRACNYGPRLDANEEWDWTIRGAFVVACETEAGFHPLAYGDGSAARHALAAVETALVQLETTQNTTDRR